MVAPTDSSPQIQGSPRDAEPCVGDHESSYNAFGNQTITWINTDLSSIGPFGTNVIELESKQNKITSKKNYMKSLSAS